MVSVLYLLKYLVYVPSVHLGLLFNGLIYQLQKVRAAIELALISVFFSIFVPVLYFLLFNNSCIFLQSLSQHIYKKLGCIFTKHQMKIVSDLPERITSRLVVQIDACVFHVSEYFLLLFLRKIAKQNIQLSFYDKAWHQSGIRIDAARFIMHDQ